MRNDCDDLRLGAASSGQTPEIRLADDVVKTVGADFRRLDACLEHADELLAREPTLRRRDKVSILRGYAAALPYYRAGDFPWWRIEALLRDLGSTRPVSPAAPEPAAIAPAPPPPPPPRPKPLPAPKPKPKISRHQRPWMRRHEGRWVTAAWLKRVLARQ